MEMISKLLSFVPDKLLSQLAVFKNVHQSTKKLQGQLVFKLLVYIYRYPKRQQSSGYTIGI